MSQPRTSTRHDEKRRSSRTSPAFTTIPMTEIVRIPAYMFGIAKLF